MRKPQTLRVTILALLAVSASIGYLEYLALYGVEVMEVKMTDKSYDKRVFEKAGGAGMLSRVYKGNITISLTAPRPVRVEFKEAIIPF
jgi:hypothetical protein